MPAGWEHLLRIAQEEVELILATLPIPLREKAREIPVLFERVPSAGWIADGIEADSLGLFVGAAFPDEETSSQPAPPEIFLFLENLWDFSQANEAIYREELRRTYLHELGHFLGLAEDDLFDRGLE
jgi:predicted Zn-dependent protease with MMP-like domain